MKGKMQKISSDNCLQEDRAELDNSVGVQTFIWITEKEDTEGLRDYYKKVVVPL